MKIRTYSYLSPYTRPPYIGYIVMLDVFEKRLCLWDTRRKFRLFGTVRKNFNVPQEDNIK